MNARESGGPPNSRYMGCKPLNRGMVILVKEAQPAEKGTITGEIKIEDPGDGHYGQNIYETITRIGASFPDSTSALAAMNRSIGKATYVFHRHNLILIDG